MSPQSAWSRGDNYNNNTRALGERRPPPKMAIIVKMLYLAMLKKSFEKFLDRDDFQNLTGNFPDRR